MNLQDKLSASFIAFEQNCEFDSPLHQMRTEAFHTFEQKGFPTKKDESWKYTSLNAIVKDNYTIFPKNETPIEFKDVRKYFLHEIDTYKLVFIDGKFSSFLSQTTHEGIDVCLLSSVLQKPKYQLVFDKYYNQIAKKDENLTALNTAFASEGAYVNVPKGKIADKPLEIIYFSTGSDVAMMTQPRSLVVVQENAHLQVVERHISLTENAVLTNAVTEIFVEKRGIIDFYKIQNDHANASLIDNTYISQKQDSLASVHTISLGGKLIRNNLNFYHKGEHINSVLNGVTIINQKQHVDHYTLVHHAEPNCESHQNYKGIFAEQSTGVFNGKIYVEKEAQKTDAFQQNNNILLGDRATVNAKPQLEIFADDVKCSHGCTVGQLNEEALFYMQQRGILKKEARGLLMYAFANEAIENIKIPVLKQRITKLIAEKLGVNLGFDL